MRNTSVYYEYALEEGFPGVAPGLVMLVAVTDQLPAGPCTLGLGLW